MVRDERAKYVAVAERLGLSRSAIHKYVAGVQKKFRDALPSIGITPPVCNNGGRPRVRRERTTKGRDKLAIQAGNSGTSATNTPSSALQ
jgi:hypothetical protein